MGIIDNAINGIAREAAAALGYVKANLPDFQKPDWLRATARAEAMNQINPAMWEKQAELYQRLSWVQIAVSTIANAAATTGFSVKEMDGDDKIDIVNHPFEQLLQKPNDLMSRFEFLVSLISFRSLTGNSYVWLNKMNETSEPDEMWVIPAQMIRPVPDEQMFLRGYLYDPGTGQDIALEPWEISHSKTFNPFSVFVGMSPIEALAIVAVGDMKMQQWNTKFFGDNNARLPGILAFADPINDPDWEKLLAETKASANKRDQLMIRNAGKGGVEWIQAAVSQHDMEFLSGRKANKEEIYAVYAPGLASTLDVNATEASAKAGKETLREYGLWPVLVSVAEKFTADILPVYGDNLVGEFDDVRIVDRVVALEEQQEFSKTHTIDEIRKKFYGGAELGDVRGNLIPEQVAPTPLPFARSDDPDVSANTSQAPVVAASKAITEGVPDLVSDEGVTGELKAWNNFAVARFGKESRPFKCEHIPDETQAVIRSGLKRAASIDDIGAVFSAFSEPAEQVFDNLEKPETPDGYTELIERLEAGMAVLMEASE